MGVSLSVGGVGIVDWNLSKLSGNRAAVGSIMQLVVNENFLASQTRAWHKLLEILPKFLAGISQ